MKNKKGFTLVELLAVIVILGIILSITTITVINTINKSQNESNQISDDLIKKAAELYISENSYKIKSEIEKSTNSSDSIEVMDLKEKGYLKVNESYTDNRSVFFGLADDNYTIIITALKQ